VTIQGPSPESCEAATSNTVSANLSGAMHGSFTMKVTGTNPVYNDANAAAWNGVGGTQGFVTAAYGGDSTYTVGDYYFKYTTKNAAACSKKWINSVTGNSGDIATFCA